MRSLVAVFGLVCAGVLVAGDLNFAQDKKDEKKEVVLKGLIACYKCELGKGTECATLIQVKGDKKETLYFFDKDSHAKYHDDICSGAKKGTVVGTVKDVDKKKVVSVKKLTYQ